MHHSSIFKKYPKITILLFNLVLLLLLFIIFEIILRIFAPDWLDYTMKYLRTGKGFGNGSDAAWDVKYKNGEFYSFTPNTTFKMYHQEYEKTVHINALGGRASIKNEPADLNNVIPFTGDSFIMGVGVEDSENIVSVIKKMTNYNFLNLGVPGTALPQQRKIIDMRYDELQHPPVVIYGFFTGNDFQDIIRAYLHEDSLYDSSRALNNFIKTPVKYNPNSFSGKLNHFIAHNDFLNKLYSLQFIKQKILNISNRNKPKDIEPIFFISDLNNKEYIQKASLKLDKEIYLLSKKPYRSIVVIIPDRAQIDSSIRKKLCTLYDLNKKDMEPFLPNKIVMAVLKKYNIPYIDATECLMKRQHEGVLYYETDNHLTKLGNKIVAECIEQQLRIYTERSMPKPSTAMEKHIN